MLKSHVNVSIPFEFAGRKFILAPLQSLTREVTGWNQLIEDSLAKKYGSHQVEVLNEDGSPIEREVKETESELQAKVKSLQSELNRLQQLLVSASAEIDSLKAKYEPQAQPEVAPVDNASTDTQAQPNEAQVAPEVKPEDVQSASTNKGKK